MVGNDAGTARIYAVIEKYAREFRSPPVYQMIMLWTIYNGHRENPPCDQGNCCSGGDHRRVFRNLSAESFNKSSYIRSKKNLYCTQGHREQAGRTRKNNDLCDSIQKPRSGVVAPN
mmetsp:Transcript_20622/g.59875  ORF Transcript_20622/g.59875 Transcript_20622/m.59875 type:complete len:116 (-) Transcript_20622:562-909(-)